MKQTIKEREFRYIPDTPTKESLEIDLEVTQRQTEIENALANLNAKDEPKKE